MRLIAKGSTIITETGDLVAHSGTTCGGLAERLANTQRLVACHNACDGIDVEDLRNGFVNSIVQLLETAVWDLKQGAMPDDDWMGTAQAILRKVKP